VFPAIVGDVVEKMKDVFAPRDRQQSLIAEELKAGDREVRESDGLRRLRDSGDAERFGSVLCAVPDLAEPRKAREAGAKLVDQPGGEKPGIAGRGAATRRCAITGEAEASGRHALE
jgi:hypothetical protein